MRDNKAQCFAFTYKQEGGYGDDPYDPGGATNLGIIQTEYDRYRQAKGLAVQSVKHITRDEADEIYTKSYWNKIDGDDLPPGIDLVIYDYAVNSGPYRAIRYAQMCVKVDVDGVMGPITLAALSSADPKVFIDLYDAKRLSFLQGLSIWWRFGKGWGRRVKDCTNAALAMVGETPKYTVQQETAHMPLLYDVIYGIARHLITGAGIGVAGVSGNFDLHNPATWLGLATFLGGSIFSGVDKAQKAAAASNQPNMDWTVMLVSTLQSINEKLDAAEAKKA